MANKIFDYTACRLNIIQFLQPRFKNGISELPKLTQSQIKSSLNKLNKLEKPTSSHTIEDSQIKEMLSVLKFNNIIIQNPDDTYSLAKSFSEQSSPLSDVELLHALIFQTISSLNKISQSNFLLTLYTSAEKLEGSVPKETVETAKNYIKAHKWTKEFANDVLITLVGESLKFPEEERKFYLNFIGDYLFNEQDNTSKILTRIAESMPSSFGKNNPPSSNSVSHSKVSQQDLKATKV